MNAHVQLRLDRGTFSAWLDRQEVTFEWKEGRVIDMGDVTRDHARIVANVLRTISNRVDLDRWSVTASDFGVEDPIAAETRGWLRFPDLIVEPMDGDGKARRSLTPILLVETLSPSSVGRDMTEKREEYAELTSLEAYVVVSQDQPILWLWRRDATTGVFPTQPLEIAGRVSHLELDLACCSLDIPLAEIYRGVAMA